MNLALFYDTETTGLPLFAQPSNDPRQPHLVQLAAHLVDMDTRNVLQTIDLIARPNGWSIPGEAAAVHGISNDYAKEVGIEEDALISLFLDLQKGPDGEGRKRIAHNEQFDARILRIGIKRYFNDTEAEKFKAAEAECTCTLATPIVNCPPTAKMKARGMRGPKKPNLQEAYKHFFDEGFEGAHSAIADVNACMGVYFAIQDNH